MTALDRGSIDYKSELFRKGIHLCSLSIPVVYYFITRELALMILVPLVIISLT
ncbi:MAG TPA: dolichol kinase, partial [Ignavibacteria bacterium]|nr:dolichol kinase [Ignavibacteria bacterium]